MKTLAARFAIVCISVGLFPSSTAYATPLWRQVGVVRDGVNGVTGLQGVYDLVTSSDGLYAYSAAYTSSAISVFARDPATGMLTQQQVLQDDVGGVAGIGATRALRISPDGKFLYAAGQNDNSIAIFDRNSLNGQLTYLSSYSNGGVLNGLTAVNAMNISNDGKFLYASSEQNHSLSTFARDQSTGALTFVETLKDGIGPTTTLNTIRSFTITDDDRFLYVPARDDNDLTQFSRDPITGKLSVVQALIDSPDFFGPTHIAFSPTGQHAYVTEQFGDAISLFDVDSLSGNLTFKSRYVDTFGGFDYLDLPEDVTVTADGKFVLVSVVRDDALNIYLRDPITGELTEHQQFVNTVAGIEGLNGAREIYLSPDQKFLYVMGAEENAIAIFTVPEPSTFGIAALGLAVAGGIACKRRKQQHRLVSAPHG
ncbi:MAG: beta-propeller fold lactonase family protein [Pirellulales bacterium]|nr:beta-propeller fold lactonase family protein [Pirellulales bacterium]